MRSKFVLFLFALSLLGPTSPTLAGSLSTVFQKVNPTVVVIFTQEHGHSGINPSETITITRGGLGSGIVVSKDGLVMTSAHVVQVADAVAVKFLDGKVVGAKVVGSALQADVALLKLNEVPDNLVAAELGNSDKVDIGDEIFVIGAPYGVDHTLTVGHMSGRRRPKNTCDPLTPVEFLQTDAAINKGNSGGPMFDMDGRLVGIVSHILSQSGGSEGLGFAASVNTARELLLNQKSFWSGLEGYLLSGPLAQALNVPQDAGLLIQRVADDSPGHDLGLKPGMLLAQIGGQQLLIGGDIVLEVQGVPISAEFEETCKVRHAVLGVGGSGSMNMKILRGGQIINLRVPKHEENGDRMYGD
jgi:S1-C subfamily serine protease